VKDERSANAYDKAAVCKRPTRNYYSTQILRLPSRTSVANRPLLPRRGVNKMERLCPLLDQSGQGGLLTNSAQAISAQLLKADIRTAAQAHIATVRQANFAEVQLAIFSID